MPFADPNEYFRTHTQQTANIAGIRSQTNKDWFSAMQPWYDTLKTWYSENQAMARQQEGQRFAVEEEIPAQTEAQSSLERLRMELETGAPGYQAGVEKTRAETAGLPSAGEARAGRESDIAYKGKAGAGIMSAEEEARLRREEMASAERRAQIGAGGKAGAENPSEVIWTFLKENLPVSHADWVKDAAGNWSLEGIRADRAKVDQVVSEFEGTYARLYKPEDVKNMADALRTILSTGEIAKADLNTEATKMSKATGVDRGLAGNLLSAAWKILNAPFGAVYDEFKIIFATPAAELIPAIRNYLNTYLPGNLGDRLYPAQKPPVNVSPALPPPPTTRRSGF